MNGDIPIKDIPQNVLDDVILLLKNYLVALYIILPVKQHHDIHQFLRQVEFTSEIDRRVNLRSLARACSASSSRRTVRVLIAIP